jgi:hypothetical protein
MISSLIALIYSFVAPMQEQFIFDLQLPDPYYVTHAMEDWTCQMQGIVQDPIPDDIGKICTELVRLYYRMAITYRLQRLIHCIQKASRWINVPLFIFSVFTVGVSINAYWSVRSRRPTTAEGLQFSRDTAPSSDA